MVSTRSPQVPAAHITQLNIEMSLKLGRAPSSGCKAPSKCHGVAFGGRFDGRYPMNSSQFIGDERIVGINEKKPAGSCGP